MRVAALCLAILVTITAAQAQQNPALTGEPLIGALPEVNPFETEADIQQGAALFQTHCSYCHGIRQNGTDLGPALDDIGRRRGLAFLEESLVKPEAHVANAFRAIQLVLKSGETVAGVRLNEDDLSVQLRDLGGNLRSFSKDNIRE